MTRKATNFQRIGNPSLPTPLICQRAILPILLIIRTTARAASLTTILHINLHTVPAHLCLHKLHSTETPPSFIRLRTANPKRLRLTPFQLQAEIWDLDAGVPPRTIRPRPTSRIQKSMTDSDLPWVATQVTADSDRDERKYRGMRRGHLSPR